MLELLYAAQEHYEQLLADAERARRYSRSVNSVRYAAGRRDLFLASGNLLIALGMRLKAISPSVRGEEAVSDSVR